MDIEKIEKAMAQCNLGELQILEGKLQTLIKKAKAIAATLDDDSARKLRAESRFSTKIHGSLRRISDVAQGQKTEYPVHIMDVSRNGMCIQVTCSFVLSRIIEVTFQGPGGKMKTCLLEAARMRRVNTEKGKVLELGCRVIEQEVANKVLADEKRDRELQAKLENKNLIQVFIVSPHSALAKRMAIQVKSDGYSAKIVDSLRSIGQSPTNGATRVAILVESKQYCKEGGHRESLVNAPQDISRVAILEEDTPKAKLITDNIVDEFVPMKNWDTLLARAIDRSILGRSMRAQTCDKKALIICQDSVTVNMLNYHLQENHIECINISDIQGLSKVKTNNIVITFADFDPNNLDSFQRLIATLKNTPVVAICEHITYGNHAIACNATDYISTPIKESQLEILLQATLANNLASV